MYYLCIHFIYSCVYIYIYINIQTYVYTHICCYGSCTVVWEGPWFCSTLTLELHGHDTTLAQALRWENCVFPLAAERGYYFPSTAVATGLKAGATGRHTYYHISPRRSQLGMYVCVCIYIYIHTGVYIYIYIYTIYIYIYVLSCSAVTTESPSPPLYMLHVPRGQGSTYFFAERPSAKEPRRDLRRRNREDTLGEGIKERGR